MKDFKKLIEKAKELSKEKFIAFAKGIFDTDAEVWEHLWKVPIFSNCEVENIIATTLSTKSKEEISEILEYCIQDEIGESEAVFIPFYKFSSEFSEEEIKEYKEKVEDEIIKEEYEAVIVYNEDDLKEQLEELIEENSKKTSPKSQEELNELFIKYVAAIFNHERCHLNANTLVCDTKTPELDELVNGAEISLSEIGKNMGILASTKRNEVLIDTLSEMMMNYEKGDSIEDCLNKIMISRKGKSQYTDIDDEVVLQMYIKYPRQITKWAMFGAYDDIHINLLNQKLETEDCSRNNRLKMGIKNIITSKEAVVKYNYDFGNIESILSQLLNRDTNIEK